jgi:hypothetical protein
VEDGIPKGAPMSAEYYNELVLEAILEAWENEQIDEDVHVGLAEAGLL